MKEVAIYIHIPFCESKCYYCDFCSYSNQDNIVDKYLKYLKIEIDIYSHILKDYVVKTIFIGGGTPSYIDAKYILDIFNYLNKRLKLHNAMEISIEINPKTLNKEKLTVYKDVGINRLSLGVQSLDDTILSKLGRIHTKKDFLETYRLLRNNGFNNINVDIMFNLPNQSIKDVINTLNEVISLDVEHISYYSLKIEEGTDFYQMNKRSQLPLPNEDEERLMYHKGIELLEDSRYKHYEISNFAKKGYECKHNMFYWTVKPYIGIGLSAHSNINQQRYGNTGSFKDYFNDLDNLKLPVTHREIIDKATEMSEYMILGLRLIDGIKKNNFKDRFGIDINKVFEDKLKMLHSKSLLINNSHTVKLTTKGLDLSNRVFMELL